MVQITTDSSKVKIYFLPARHWSKRGLFDTNQRLWGSFIIQTLNRTIYFSGDTGYGSHFKEIGSLFKDINIAIMGIGAYEPEWFMSPNHISPKDALRAASEMSAKTFIPMHYGTFDLSDEPLFEPINSLKDLHKNTLSQIELLSLKIGQNYKIPN
ncbi:MAG: MBL fold metallo-hydrolase [Bacteroidota bacterium]